MIKQLSRFLHPVLLPIRGGLRQVVIYLWQQRDADDVVEADESAAGKHRVVMEIALLIVEVHDSAIKQANISTGEDQAQTSATVIEGWKMIKLAGTEDERTKNELEKN